MAGKSVRILTKLMLNLDISVVALRTIALKIAARNLLPR